ncbi:MAG: 16S rRNA (guanine(527)-N(7))-methyltransferase RsmG [Candidatus Acidiferrales bacterium]
MSAPLSHFEIARELAPFEITLSPPALSQLSRYLELLLRWNERINLTGIRDPNDMVRRLFGESLSIARAVELRGWLVDIGSGAGFPGLALKLMAPDLRVTLIEARQKKCAFLKQVALECGFTGVEVVAERFEDWARGAEMTADLITTRAVNVDRELLQNLKSILAPGGKAVFLTTADLAEEISSRASEWKWARSKTASTGKGTIVLIGSQL